MAFQRLLAKGNHHFKPFYLAWNTEPSRTSVGSPPLVREAVFVEDHRRGGRVAVLVAAIEADGASDHMFLRILERILVIEPKLDHCEPTDLLHRLHSYLTSVFQNYPSGWGAGHVTLVILEPDSRSWRVHRAGAVPPLLERSISNGWRPVNSVDGPYLGVPGTGGVKGTTADQLFPDVSWERELGLRGDAISVVTRGLHDTVGGGPPTRVFGTASDGLIPTLNETHPTDRVEDRVLVVSERLIEFRRPVSLDHDATILVVQIGV